MFDIIGVQEANLIHSRLGDLIDAHLPLAVCAFTSGSIPYGAAVRGRSDIDVNVIFPVETTCSDALLSAETSEETWYLAWLGALSFSWHVAGKSEPFRALRRQGWQTMILICLRDLAGQPVTRQLVLDRILQSEHPSGGFGVHPGYRRFEELERSSTDQTLGRLAEQGYLHMSSSGYTVRKTALDAWQEELAARHAQGFTAANLLTVSSSKRLTR